MRKSVLLTAMISSSLVLRASGTKASNLADFAVFGNSGVTYQGFSTTVGNVGSNADINLLGASTKITSLQGYGNFNGSGDFQTVSGATIFNGNVIGGPLSSYGSVDAGGSASLQGNVTSNITVGNNLSLSTFNKVGGNALIGGNANLSGSNTVAGTLGVNGNLSIGSFSNINNLIYGGALTDDSTTTIANQSQGTVAVHPQAVAPVALPASTNFVAGGPDEILPLFANVTLVPGHYGALTFNGSNTLNLTAGNYYFSSIQSAGEFTTLNLNLSAGAINLFVTGNVDLLAVTEKINGQSFSTAQPWLASDVYLEAGGSVIFDNVPPANGSDFFGTIYAPDGPITTGLNETFIGSLLSGQSVTVGGANITYEPTNFQSIAVPEPATALVAVGVAGMLLGRRRQRPKLRSRSGDGRIAS